MNTILAIACGGAFGAVMRHFFNIGALKMFGDGFPFGTLGVNIIGSFLMGILISTFAYFWQPSQDLRVFLITGFLGAFTTFSTFSLDVSVLFERGDFAPAAIYIVTSVVFSIAALFLGMFLIRALAA